MANETFLVESKLIQISMERNLTSAVKKLLCILEIWPSHSIWGNYTRDAPAHVWNASGDVINCSNVHKSKGLETAWMPITGRRPNKLLYRFMTQHYAVTTTHEKTKSWPEIRSKSCYMMKESNATNGSIVRLPSILKRLYNNM